MLPQTALEECNGYLKADFEGSLGCRGVTVPLDVDTMYMYPIVNFVITQVEIIERIMFYSLITVVYFPFPFPN